MWFYIYKNMRKVHLKKKKTSDGTKVLVGYTFIFIYVYKLIYIYGTMYISWISCVVKWYQYRGRYSFSIAWA